MNRPCNCRGNDPNAKCGYDNICRNKLVVYQAECKATGKVYIGSTHRTVKDRMEEHNSDIKICQKTGKSKSSFSSHFATVLQNFNPITTKLIKNSINYSILWQGNPLSTVQTFGTSRCRLCAKERIEIMKRARHKPLTLINRRIDFYESCKHIPQVHRFKAELDDSTDEA